ncbi:MAG: Ig-like domain-containing protein [Chloroflexi bacterium]|nr:Ig-like domain-containing protein [Chloroflexota bacterium]
MFQHDPQHTGQSPYIGPQTDDLLWSYDVGDFAVGSPVVGSDGTIYVPVKHIWGPCLVAVKPNGSLKYSVGRGPGVTPAIGTDGTIYIGRAFVWKEGIRGSLAALDPDTGAPKWGLQITGLRTSLLIAPDDTIYVGAGYEGEEGATLYAINPDGTIKWKFVSTPREGWFLSPPALGLDGSIIACATFSPIAEGPPNPTIYALNAEDGSLEWQFELPFWTSVSMPAVGPDGTIYVGSSGGEGGVLYSVSPNGNLNWEVKLGTGTSSPAVGSDGTVYIAAASSEGGALFAVNPDGTVKWSYPCSYACHTPVIGADGTTYWPTNWPSGRGVLMALDSEGSLKLEYAIDSHWASSASISANGTLYIGSADGMLYAIGPGPADTTPPTVVSAFPEGGATDVSIDTVITATFSEAMDSSTITTDSFTLAGSAVSGTVTYDPETYTATFTPGANLDYDHEYTATLSTDITDEAGNPLAEPYTWSFTSESAPADTTPPNTEVTSGPSGTIDYDDVIFTWTGVDNVTPTSGLVYSYYLQGYDSDWSAWTSDTTKQYTDLPDGDYTFKVKAKDQAGNTDPTPAERSFTVEVVWSFAIITDLHIGRGYLDYGGEGIGPEDWQVEGQDYYLTNRLHRTVDWIIQNQDNYDLKFVIVLGDISDSGEYSELKKAKDILDELNDAGIPYVPMIGNHDVLPYTEDEEFEHVRYFEFVFEEQFESLMEDPSFNLIKQPAPEPYDLQNYAFGYGGIGFVILDCVAREPVPGAAKGVGSDAVLRDSTLLWLTENLKEGQPTVILSHHPLVTPEGGFDPWEIVTIDEAIKISGADVLADFAGHVHGFYDPSTLWRPGLPYPIGNPSFMDANTIYAGLGVPEGVPAITTEALMVASNDPISKGVVRIIEAEGSQITIPLEVQGELPALNPYFKQVDVELQPALGWPPFKWVIEVEAYAFTKLFSEEHPVTYTLYIDGEEVGSVQSVSWLNAVEFEHEYRGDKFYNFNLTVEGYVPGSESISQTRYLCRPDLLFAAFSPVDITVIDPDGLTIGKQLNQIPGATYIEEDFNGDGNPDDVITIPDRKIGDYIVTVLSDPGASPTDTYSLGVLAEDGTILPLAENVAISNIPSLPYIVRSTETEIIQIILARIDFDPDTLNLKTKDKYVTVYIELPPGYDVAKIDVSSIRLNGTVPALTKPTNVGDYDSDGIPDLMVKFDRAAVKDLLTPGSQVEITVTGEVAGIGFEGSDTIRVISK